MSDENTGGAAAVRTSDGATLAARLGVGLWELEVVESTVLAPQMRRLRLRAPGLDALGAQAGQDLMFAVPTGTEATFRRRYTIRRFLPEVSMIDVDIVIHGDGPGAGWAASARPGDRIEAIGPRGKVLLVDDADWHLFAGDESGLPACVAMIEALPAGSRAIAIVEVPDSDYEQAATVADDVAVDVTWLHRGSAEPGRAERLVGAVDAVDLPNGRGHAYLTGELRVVDAMRQTLVARGLESDQLSPKSYWRLGVANAAHGEPPKP